MVTLTRLELLVPQAPVAPGTRIALRARLDAGDAVLGAAVVRWHLPLHLFADPTVLEHPFVDAAFASNGPVGPEGVFTIAGARDNGAAGRTTLTVEVTAVGPSDAALPVTVEVADAVAADGRALRFGLVTEFVGITTRPVTVVSTSLPLGSATVPYHAGLLAEGGRPPLHWTVAGGSLPPGVSLDGAGLLRGTPASPGTSRFTARVSDASTPARDAVAEFELVVGAAPLRVVTDRLPPIAFGRIYDAPLRTGGGSGGVSWRAEGLPSGLAIVDGAIRGSLADRPTTFAPVPVALEVEDSGTPRQTARRTLMLPVTPLLPSAEVTVEAPTAVAVGRDLVLCEYDYSVSAAAAHASRDIDFERAIDDAKADLLAELFFSDLDDLAAPVGGPPGHGPEVDDPHGYPDWGDGSGTPGLDDGQGRPGQHGGPRDRGNHLIDLYRELDDAQDMGPAIWFDLTLEIDGVAFTGLSSDASGSGFPPTRHALPRAAPTGKGARGLLYAVGGPLGIPLARRTIDRLLRPSVGVRRQTWAGGRFGLATTLAWGAGLAATAATAAAAGWAGFFAASIPAVTLLAIASAYVANATTLRARRFIDEKAKPDRPTRDVSRRDGPAIRLTPGAHVLTARWSSTTIGEVHGPYGADRAMSASFGFVVAFTPRNPHRWPRLSGTTTVQGGGLRGSGQADYALNLTSSDLDLLIAGADGCLRIAAARGDGSFAEPVEFAASGGGAGATLAVRPIDRFGRSSVLAADGGDLLILYNNGLEGFLERRVPLRPSRSPARVTNAAALPTVADDVRARSSLRRGLLFREPAQTAARFLFSIEAARIGSEAWMRAFVGLDNRIACIAGLDRLADAQFEAEVTMLEAGSTIEEPVERILRDPEGSRFLLLRRVSGQVAHARLGADAAEVELLPGLDERQLQLQPVDLAIAKSVTDTHALAVPLRQARELRLYDWRDGAWTAGRRIVLPFRPRQAAAGPRSIDGILVAGQSLGIVALVLVPAGGNDGVVVPMLETEGYVHLAAAHGLSAVADYAGGRVVVYR